MTDQDWWRLGFFVVVFFVAYGLGRSLEQINETLERIADTLQEMSEGREGKDQ